MVPLNEFERFTERVLRNCDRESTKAILRSVSSFLPHLAIDQTFQNAATTALLRDDNLPAPSVEVVRDVLARLTGDSASLPVPTGESIR